MNKADKVKQKFENNELRIVKIKTGLTAILFLIIMQT